MGQKAFKLVVVYNLKQGVNPEDFEQWFFQVHIPDVKRYPGVRKVVANKVVGTSDGSPPGYYRTAELHFDDRKAFEEAWKWREEHILPYKEHSMAEWMDGERTIRLLCEGEELISSEQAGSMPKAFKVILVYNLKAGINPDDFEQWFFQVHIPDVKRYPGIREVVANKVVGMPDGKAPSHYRTAELHFDDRKAFEEAWKWRAENILSWKGHSPREWMDFDRGAILLCEGEEIIP